MTDWQWAEAYLRHLAAERNLSPYTVRNYRNDLRQFFEFLAREELQVASLTRQDFRAYLSLLHQKGTAPASVARKVSTVRSFYRFLVREGAIPSNPLEQVRGPKRPRRLPSYLTYQHVAALIEAADDESPQGIRDRALLELVYAAGVRLSEVVGLDVDDVDLEEATARVMGKGGKERIVLLGTPAVEALRRYLVEARPLLTRDAHERALFLNRDGQRLSGRWVQELVKKYAQRAGIDKRVWPHLLRHSFATHLLDGGADLRVVQELLGHATPTSTQVYLHVTQERQRQRYLEAFRHRRGRRPPAQD
ncbi:MAG: site-specific tyrosine recombinase XerD [Dehalococcoidia bacterium]|nr:site-specific tyrosine recombinase XerD [Dehalococcoidia bacterium]MDW8007946.1 site-specific tyrosine recombinase XerD [Chloroflexota bacterium]